MPGWGRESMNFTSCILCLARKRALRRLRNMYSTKVSICTNVSDVFQLQVYYRNELSLPSGFYLPTSEKLLILRNRLKMYIQACLNALACGNVKRYLLGLTLRRLYLQWQSTFHYFLFQRKLALISLVLLEIYKWLPSIDY